jgi:predicted O-methyltransferase YrrM
MRNRLLRVIAYMRHVLTATRKGHSVHSPFAFALCEEVFYNTLPFYDFEKFAHLRKKILKDQRILQVEDLGAGSSVLKGKERKVADIAAMGISTHRQSEILYRLVHYLGATNVIELGTSIGLNTLYLAKAASRGRVYTVEGAASLSSYAAALAGVANQENIDFINQPFDVALPALLTNNGPPDLVYIDGNHTYNATMKYYAMIREARKDSTVIVLDDIYWNEEMTRAWKEILADKTITLSIDGFVFGLLFFRKEIKERVRLKVLL